MIRFDDHMFQNGLKSPTGESNMAHVEPQQIKHPKTSRTLVAYQKIARQSWEIQKLQTTVDGQNPAPPRMMIIPLFLGF